MMQGRMLFAQRASSKRGSSQDRPESNDLLNQVQALSSSGSSSSPNDDISLLVKGRPLHVVIQVLADALLQQQVQFHRTREAAEAREKQTDALFADYRDTLGRVKDDIHFSHRPFVLNGGSGASFTSSGTSRGEKQRMSPLHREHVAETLAEAVRLTHQQHEQLRHVVFSFSAGAHANKLEHKQLEQCFACWRRCGVRRVQAKKLEESFEEGLLSTYYTRWKRQTESNWRQQRLRTERHLRAVARRSRNAILSVYLHKWVAFATVASNQTAQLGAYQKRIATVWSVCGPAVTSFRRDVFKRWQRWASRQIMEKHVFGASAALELQCASRHDVYILKGSFTSWRKKTQRRRLSRLYHRLARVMSAQSNQTLLRHHFRAWIISAEHARRLRRLEVLAADQHKRRVTALARRYFNGLRYFRREQQFQRMMHRVEALLLTLADRVCSVEDAVFVQDNAAPPIAAARMNQLFVSSPRAPPLPPSALPVREERCTPRVQWNPGSDEELLTRVEEMLFRSR